MAFHVVPMLLWLVNKLLTMVEQPGLHWSHVFLLVTSFLTNLYMENRIIFIFQQLLGSNLNSNGPYNSLLSCVALIVIVPGSPKIYVLGIFK